MGDQVLSEDPSTGAVEAEPVQAVIADPASPLVAVQLSDGSAITATADHPFWVEVGVPAAHRGAWVEAGQLRAGLRVRTASGADLLVTGVKRHAGYAPVYTLTVATDHAFFVGVARVLVHNAECTLVRSLVKKVPSLNEIAQNLGRNPRWREEANSLVQQYMRGNTNPGLGTKHLFGRISYLRGRNGARVFFRTIGSNAFEIVAYADKSTENRVIALLEQYYGGS